jgi:WD40 repeat protein
MFAVSPRPNQVELRSSKTGTIVRRLRGPAGYANDMRFSSDGSLLGVAGSRDVVVWDVRSGKVVKELAGGSTTVGFSPDGRLLAFLRGNSIVLYDLRIGHQVAELPGNDGSPMDIDFSPDGKLLASAPQAGITDLWDVTTRKLLAKLATGTFDTTVRFSPDGRLLAVGDTSGNVVVWDVAKRRPVGTPLSGQNVLVDAVGFDPSGRMLITMSDDGNLRLWDVATQKLIGAPIPVSTGGGTAEFFPDGTHVLGDFGTTAVIWNVDPAAWEAKACSVADRNLTPAEWRTFLGSGSYREVCP